VVKLEIMQIEVEDQVVRVVEHLEMEVLLEQLVVVIHLQQVHLKVVMVDLKQHQEVMLLLEEEEVLWW
jgi:hypothetical protein